MLGFQKALSEVYFQKCMNPLFVLSCTGRRIADTGACLNFLTPVCIFIKDRQGRQGRGVTSASNQLEGMQLCLGMHEELPGYSGDLLQARKAEWTRPSMDR